MKIKTKKSKENTRLEAKISFFFSLICELRKLKTCKRQNYFRFKIQKNLEKMIDNLFSENKVLKTNDGDPLPYNLRTPELKETRNIELQRIWLR